MATEQDNLDLRATLDKLREKLPPAAVDGPEAWLTMEQIAAKLDTTTAEVEKLLEKVDTSTDGNGRKIISVAYYEQFILTGEGTFL